jgi:quercetin dioxygenase-like cupin family protein
MERASDNFQFGSELPWEPAGEGVQRQVLGYDEKLMLIRVKFEAGAIGAMHSHPHSQATYVESGRFAMTIGDETREIRVGDGYRVPPEVIHGITCLEAGVLIDAFSPLREDFLVG